MRELTTLENQQQAERLTGYLVSQSIPSSVEQEGSHWIVWVVNDDDRDAAQKIFAEFQANPDDSRYSAGLVKAKQQAREEAASQRKARRRQVDLTKRWSGHWWYAHPATTILIGISVLVSLLCTDWRNPEPGWLGLPALCNNDDSPILKRLFITDFELTDRLIVYPRNPFAPFMEGEVWRLLTPMFLHFGVLHLLFNMMWMWQLAAAVEFVKGTRRFLLLVLLLEVPSSVAQFYMSGPLFGGMSGVVFGMIGYVWMKGKTQPHEGLALMPQTIVYAFLWLFLCMGGAVGNIANTAHLVGFGMGIFLGARGHLLKLLMRKLRS